MKNDILNWCRKGDYQRENFDSFLKFVKFKYNVPSAHIAGTNGKGSTAHFLEMTYIDAGYTVGSFCSPYLYDVNELIKVNNKPISDEDFMGIYKEYERLFKKFDLSEFEIETFIALTYFEKSNCNICFIECGMGGELDATNIFTQVLSIITTIGLEHTAYLGKTLCEIAYSKSGIIKDEIPVVIGKLNSEAEQTIIEVANDHLTKVHKVVEPANLTCTNEGYKFNYESYQDIVVNNHAEYIVSDACIALESLNFLKADFPISLENIQHGFASKTLDARFTILEKDNHIIIDGAHNPEGCENLVNAINSGYNSAQFHIVFACFRDKNLERMLANLGTITNDIVLTYFPHERCRNEDDYFLFLGEYRYEADPVEAVKKLREEFPDDYVLVTGSLAFAGYMLNLLK